MLDVSHEIDFVGYLFGSIKHVEGRLGRMADITVDSEDFVDALFTLEGDVPVNLHLNFLSRHDERTIKIDFKDGYIIGDIITGKVTYFYKEKREEFRFNPERNEFFKEQLRYFFENINNPSIMNNLDESKGLLEKMLELKI